MKVLLVGMTAQQANPASVRRGANYPGLIVEALKRQDHEVTWCDPSISMTAHDLDQYDSVIVGVAPITSLGANRTYGALSVIKTLWASDRLTLLVDAPDPNKITGSLTAIMKQPDNLVKPFFSYRKEYLAAKTDAGRLFGMVQGLMQDRWPRVIAPSLPWHGDDFVANMQLPAGARDVTTVNLDRLLLENLPGAPHRNAPRVTAWGYEHGSNGKWLRTQNVTWETGTVAKNTRMDADKVAVEQLRQIAGLLIAPTRTGTWWNTRYVQALSQGCPVFTAWEESQVLGPEWSQLPALFELVPEAQRGALHAAQTRSYLDTIGDLDQAYADLDDALTSGRTAAA